MGLDLNPSRFVPLLWHACAGHMAWHLLQTQFLVVSEGVYQGNYVGASTGQPVGQQMLEAEALLINRMAVKVGHQ